MQIIVFRRLKIVCKWMAIKRCTKWYGEGGLIDSPIHSPCHTEIPFNKKQKPTKTSKRIVNGGKHTRDIKHFVVILYSTEREGVLPHTCHWTRLCGWLPVKRQLPDVPHHWWQHLCLIGLGIVIKKPTSDGRAGQPAPVAVRNRPAFYLLPIICCLMPATNNATFYTAAAWLHICLHRQFLPP